MLSVPQLDDLSFDKLFERARSRIPTLTGEWTDFNAHDPGITTLQTFAWLTDTLNYYMNATGEVHRLKYLKLLGLEPQQAAARCRVAVEPEHDEFLLPRGVKLAAGSTVFEVSETCGGRRNRVAALYSVVDGVPREITRIAGVDGGFAELFAYGAGERELYLGFEAPLDAGPLRLFLEVQGDARRNPFDGPFSLAELEWSCCDGQRWLPVHVAEDSTGGFLRSGFVALELPQGTGRLESPLFAPAHYLRCTLRENGYDLLPRLGRVTVNCAEAVQTDTCAQALELTYQGGELAIDYCIREDDLITVAVESPDGYVTWYEHTPGEGALCEILPGRYPWQRVIRFDEERFGRAPAVGRKVLVLIADQAVYPQTVAGVTLGCAGERLDFDWPGLLELRLALTRRAGGRVCYELWEPCADLSEAGYADRVFSYDSAAGQIVFGDGKNGLQPDGGATVVAVTVKTSAFEGGNVLAGRVNRLADGRLGPLTVVNIEDARGGKHRESAQELEARLEEKFREVTRAVTAEDYIEIVKRTPGLMIDYVNVITMRQFSDCYGAPYRPNTVLLAVKPYAHDPHATLSDRYQRAILAHLEQHRLLTTRLLVIPPQYVGVNVFGRIALEDKSQAARQRVQDLLLELIDFTKTGGFGRNVVYGRVFSALEMLDCVRGVRQLAFEAVGSGAVRNERGDIEVYPDSLAYLRAVEIEFI